jgi:predicted membrane-bound spermidine synthase
VSASRPKAESKAVPSNLHFASRIKEKPVTDAVRKHFIKVRSFLIAVLLFGSGMCALIYQTVWLREFRLIFGGSTAASAAVLAIFMGGLGVGGIVLGKRADRKTRPLRFYAHLELLIAAAAALSPFLLFLARAVYLWLGGSIALGNGPATLLRLALSVLVLGAATFLMGGTLPAAARAVETDVDDGRRRVAFVYAANTLGAVTGVLLSTFFLLERVGNKDTLWLGCAANVAVALGALSLSRFLPVGAMQSRDSQESRETRSQVAPLSLVLVAAGVTGFVFLLMELVWYRMMTPLLGGTTFTFGLILATALFGIGLGSGAYALFYRERRPTIRAFALTCGLEALFLATPFALGDRVAIYALLLRPFSALGFYGDIFAWTQITALVVFPASIVAGAQFPLLIALLGKGRHEVGSHTGLAYACNTAGAIAGSLAGGFGLLPALSATGVWKFSVIALAVLGIASWIFSYKIEARVSGIITPALATFTALLMLLARGPTAAWRQSPIGAGRADYQSITDSNKKEEWLRFVRRNILFQEDGIESSLGVQIRNGLTFLINGKSDGNATVDASTQVMSGLLGAVLQPTATRSLVVGLGTGSTAGWLADIPTMERVDVVELERAVTKVADLCAPVNQNALKNPKLHLTFGDARETLLTTKRQYDLIVSEPSNPYRAGVASLYTKEYYRAAAARLRRGGLFAQFVQAYEVDSATIRCIYATFASTFPNVETWQTNLSDLLFVGSMEPVSYDVAELRRRINEPPFKLALEKVWRVTDLEGFLAHYVANNSFAKEFASAQKAVVNTDDRNVIEFGFARTVGKATGAKITQFREAAHSRGYDRPSVTGGEVDWGRVDDRNADIDLHLGIVRPPPFSFLDEGQRRRLAAKSAYLARNFKYALELWRSQTRDAETPTELAMMADILGWSGDAENAMKYIDKVSELNQGEASMLLAFVRSRQGRFAEAATALENAFLSCRSDPWVMAPIFKGSLGVANYLASQDQSGALARQLYHALEKPFSVYAWDADRRDTLVLIGVLADGGGFSQYTRTALVASEPDVPWNRKFLEIRRNCYRALDDPLAQKAERELSQFLGAEPEGELLDSPP